MGQSKLFVSIRKCWTYDIVVTVNITITVFEM